MVAVLSFYVELPVAGGQQIAIETGPTFICNLMDDRAVALGIGGADLGVSVVDGSKLWLMFGDTRGTGPGPPAEASRGWDLVLRLSRSFRSTAPPIRG